MYIIYLIISTILMFVLFLVTRRVTNRFCDRSHLAYSIHEVAHIIYILLLAVCAIIGLFLPL